MARTTEERAAGEVGKVSLSDTTYGTLVLWVEDYAGADGRPLATEQATEGLANRSLKERNV